MKKLISLAAVLLLSGCYGGSLFDGPECPCEENKVKTQHYAERVVRPCAQTVTYVKQNSERLVGVIYFGIGSDYLNEEDKAELQRIAQAAKNTGASLKVLGHASHKVGPSVQDQKNLINMDISKKRTQNVANVLAAMGVNPNKISAAAYADSRPAQVEVDAKTEALNRRVEIYFE